MRASATREIMFSGSLAGVIGRDLRRNSFDEHESRSLVSVGIGLTSSARLFANKLLIHMRESACVPRNSTLFGRSAVEFQIDFARDRG